MKRIIKTSVFLLATLFSLIVFNNDITEKVELLRQKSEIGSKDNPIARAEYELRMLVDPVTGKMPTNIRQQEIEFVKTIPTVKENILAKGLNTNELTFKSRGPVNRGGRVRALAFDVRSTASNSVLIAAGVSGGIWRSTDGGTSWTQTSLPSQINSATCIAQDIRPGYQDTWYIGSGEAYGNSTSGGSSSYLGNGIFKSTNNGLSWSLMESTSSNSPHSFDNVFDFIHNIAVSPTTGTIFVAAINTIQKSADGGRSWSTVRSTPYNATFTDVIATANGTVYASVNSNSDITDSGIWKSTDDGNNWTSIKPTGFPSVYNRVIFAAAPSDQNKIYILATTPGSGKDGHSLWASSDAGTSWTNYSDNIPDTKASVAGYSAQGGYNMVIAVKPDDPNFVLFGGTNLHRSTDGMTTKLANSYANWIGGYSVANDVSQYTNHHADQHALVFAPYNSAILYCGNDGGVQSTNDISRGTVVWEDKNNGFITSQFYSIAMDQSASDDILLGGLQDNGHYFVNSNNSIAPWVEMIAGGDGAFTAIANGKTYYYIETQNGNVIRLQLNSAGNYSTFAVVKPDHETNYLFINPFVLDPNNSNTMYFAAGDSLWRNHDLSGIPNFGQEPTSVNWTVLQNTRTGNIITAVSASKTPANIVYYGTAHGQIYRLENANSRDPIPTNISSSLLPDAYVSSIAIDPNNANNVLAVFSNYKVISLYYSSNGGTTWTAVAGNLEENSDGSGNGPSCRWASITNYGGSPTYFVATSAGLYSTNVLDGMSTNWVQESPNEIGVSVCTMVKTREVDGAVVVATHGAGIFSSKLQTTDVADELNIPSEFQLHQNYPNPFNPSTTIDYSITEAGPTTVKVYNMKGELVADLVNSNKSVGNHTVVFDASKLSSGSYIYELISAGNSIAKKMLLIK
jgi:hypothetical protein